MSHFPKIEVVPVREWNREYAEQTAAWDTGRVSSELRRVVENGSIPAGSRVLELGCGAGTNSIFLARSGFRVTAVDFTPEALAIATDRAAEANVEVEWIQADVLKLSQNLTITKPFDFIFDRGCFHVFTPRDRPMFVEQLLAVIRQGSRYFMLCGNAREPRAGGPPVVSEIEIHASFSEFFEIESIEEFCLDTNTEGDGPLAYACWMVRR